MAVITLVVIYSWNECICSETLCWHVSCMKLHRWLNSNTPGMLWFKCSSTWFIAAVWWRLYHTWHPGQGPNSLGMCNSKYRMFTGKIEQTFYWFVKENLRDCHLAKKRQKHHNTSYSPLTDRKHAYSPAWKIPMRCRNVTRLLKIDTFMDVCSYNEKHALCIFNGTSY